MFCFLLYWTTFLKIKTEVRLKMEYFHPRQTQVPYRIHKKKCQFRALLCTSSYGWLMCPSGHNTLVNTSSTCVCIPVSLYADRGQCCHLRHTSSLGFRKVFLRRSDSTHGGLFFFLFFLKMSRGCPFKLYRVTHLAVLGSRKVLLLW